MRYRETDEVSAQALRNEASTKEQCAFAMECDVERGVAKKDSSVTQARQQADKWTAYVEMDPEEIKTIHIDFLRNWIKQLEGKHRTIKAVQKAAKDLGEDEPQEVSALPHIEKAHSFAAKKLDALVPKKPVANRGTKRTAARQSRKKTTARRTTKP